MSVVLSAYLVIFKQWIFSRFQLIKIVNNIISFITIINTNTSTFIVNQYIFHFLLVVSTGPKFPARPGPQIFLFKAARLGINILQNLYNCLNIFWRGQKLMKILLSTGIICNLISEQSQTCWILKTKILFLEFQAT